MRHGSKHVHPIHVASDVCDIGPMKLKSVHLDTQVDPWRLYKTISWINSHEK